MGDFSIRKATSNDADELYDLIVESTGAKTSLSRENFKKYLAGVYNDTEEDSNQIKSIDIVKDRLAPNCPVCQAYVAKARDQLIGYVLFHYYYTPWRGRLAFVDNIYVKKSFRRRGK